MKRALAISIAVFLFCSVVSPAQTKTAPAQGAMKPKPAATAKTPAKASAKSASAVLDLSKQPTLYVVPYAHLDTQWRWEYPQTISE